MTTKSASKRTITALVQDKPGVLNRISSMFRRRGFNIASLAVGRSETPNLSRMTFVVEGDDAVVEQVAKHLHKLVDVIRVSDMSEQNIVSRELALIRVKATSHNRSEIMQITSAFRDKIIDVTQTSFIREVTGTEQKIDALEDLLRGFGVAEIMRTGMVAMGRGVNTLSADNTQNEPNH